MLFPLTEYTFELLPSLFKTLSLNVSAIFGSTVLLAVALAFVSAQTALKTKFFSTAGSKSRSNQLRMESNVMPVTQPALKRVGRDSPRLRVHHVDDQKSAQNDDSPTTRLSNRAGARKPRDLLSVTPLKLPTPSPTPRSPCFVHSTFDPSPLCESIPDIDKTNCGELAETAASVREIAKKLGQARIETTMKNVMIVTKPGDVRLIKLTRELVLYLITTPRYGRKYGVTVYVDKQLKDQKKFGYESLLNESPLVVDNLKFWTADLCKNRSEIFNFVLTLGGDGTVLYTSWLFQEIVPPVMPFHLGSLGFLTNFDFNNYREHLTNALENGIRVNLRMRFTCTVYRRVYGRERHFKAKICKETGEVLMQNLKGNARAWEALESGQPQAVNHTLKGDKNLACFVTQPVETFEVLNDMVVDRGAGPYMSMLELFGDDQHLTTVQADGLVVATPTGSTAYSVSAGGSLVHPEIPAILLTPICPHTLSFRPMLLPDSMELRICVPYNSRSTAWASFDGRGRVELKQGDHIKITPSKFPLPTVCLNSKSEDWFNSVTRCLRWNERERQKSFVVVEDEASEEEDLEDEDATDVEDNEPINGTEGLYKPDGKLPSFNSRRHHLVHRNEVHAFACIGKDSNETENSSDSGSGDDEPKIQITAEPISENLGAIQEHNKWTEVTRKRRKRTN